MVKQAKLIKIKYLSGKKHILIDQNINLNKQKINKNKFYINQKLVLCKKDLYNKKFIISKNNIK